MDRPPTPTGGKGTVAPLCVFFTTLSLGEEFLAQAPLCTKHLQITPEISLRQKFESKITINVYVLPCHIKVLMIRMTAEIAVDTVIVTVKCIPSPSAIVW